MPPRSPPSRTKPKQDSLIKAFILAGVSAGVTVFLYPYFRSPLAPGLPPRPPMSWTVPVLSIIVSGMSAVGFVWLLNRRRARAFRPPGSCRQCGYDRTGLPTTPGAPCPECGSTAPPCV